MLDRIGTPVKILLVEDNAADARLTQESLKDCKVLNELFVVRDGVEAMEFLLRRGKYGSAPEPDLVLLDLNLPKKDGREVLSFIKEDLNLRTIPVVVLTSSRAERDIVQSYRLHCNCYITKPLDLDEFGEVVKAIEGFWFSIVKLPAPGGEAKRKLMETKELQRH
jgi:two-component system, chemotaxis family, response regulator Rcp1